MPSFAMILNGLGLVSAPLYLFSKFFEGKPTEHLIGKGIKPEHINDDRLGQYSGQFLNRDAYAIKHRSEKTECYLKPK